MFMKKAPSNLEQYVAFTARHDDPHGNQCQPEGSLFYRRNEENGDVLRSQRNATGNNKHAPG